MDLILWRHADALYTTPDLPRELSPKGFKQAKRMGQWLDARLPENCRVLSSPATRALQTVEALGRKYKIHPELAPDASALQLLQAINWPHGKEAVLVVGHQPTLGQVASTLLFGREDEFEIRKGYVCWISQREREGSVVTWMKALLGPDLCSK